MSWEVRTMRSATSCFNLTLFRKNLTRFWPIWALYALILTMLLPMSILVQAGEGWGPGRARTLPLYLINGAPGTCLLLAAFFGLLAAMAVFSYLYSSRSVGMFHALPLRREGLFLTSYLSGLAFLVLPNAAVFLLALAAEALAGTVVFSSLFTWMVVATLFCIFFYSFAVFCAMFTGHLLALPAFYCILSVLPMGLVYLMECMAEEFLFGFSGASWMYTAASWLTPVVQLSSRCFVDYPSGVQTNAEEAFFSGLGCAALYALIGLALAGVALAVYRRRQLESAGDVVSVAWVRPVFRYGVAFCAAVSLGILFYGVLTPLVPRGAWTLLLLMLVWGAVGCLLAEMLLRKSFRVLRSCWKGGVIFLCCLTAAMCVLEFDLLGFERKVPAAQEVSLVYVTVGDTMPYDDLSYTSYRMDDPDEIQAVLDLHQAIADNAARLEQEQNTRSGGWYVSEDGVDIQNQGGQSMHLVYTLTDGSLLERSYYLPVTQEELDTPGSCAALLAELVNQPSVVREGYLGNPDSRLVDAVVYDVYDPETKTYDTFYLPTAGLEELLAAVEADLSDGSLGRRYLLANEERLTNCYYSDLELTFRTALTGAADQDQEGVRSVRIGLEASARRTLAVLEKYGVDTDSQLRTQWQMMEES